MNIKLYLLALYLFTFASTYAMDQDPYETLRKYAHTDDNQAALVKVSEKVLVYASLARDHGEESDFSEAAYECLSMHAKMLQDVGALTIHASDRVAITRKGDETNGNRDDITSDESLGSLYSDIFRGKKTVSVKDLADEAQAALAKVKH